MHSPKLLPLLFAALFATSCGGADPVAEPTHATVTLTGGLDGSVQATLLAVQETPTSNSALALAVVAPTSIPGLTELVLSIEVEGEFAETVYNGETVVAYSCQAATSSGHYEGSSDPFAPPATGSASLSLNEVHAASTFDNHGMTATNYTVHGEFDCTMLPDSAMGPPILVHAVF